MALTNLMTVLKTVAMAGVKLTVPADRIGLGFGRGVANPYPTDTLSLGHFPLPQNPEPEQLRSRHGQSATPMRKQTRTDTTDAVPPASSAGCLPPGSSADRVSWPASTTNTGRDRVSKACVTFRLGSDCQSPERKDEIRGLARIATPAATAGK